jgi:hypothetical protein
LSCLRGKRGTHGDIESPFKWRYLPVRLWEHQEIFKNYSISTRKKGRNGKGMVTQSSHPTTLTKNEIGGLLEDMKNDIFHSLAM